MLVEELRTLDPEGMYAEGQNVDLERVLQDNRAGIRPLIADWAHTAQFLASRGVVLTVGARDLFLDHVAGDYLAAIVLLEQRAKGDYSPDERPQQFPPFTRREKAQGPLSPWTLFDQWVQEKKPASSTIGRWRAVFLALEARFKDGISEDAAREWVRSLVNNMRSARTVADTWLSAASTIYKWAAEQKLIAGNPFAKVKVTIPRKSKTRDKAFTPEEAKLILEAAFASRDAVKRWVPWLCAYSGARAGEITQVRGQDIEQRDGFFAMKLTPEAGTIKTRTARTVPLHEHLIAQGFLEFVKTRGRGPLFYTPVAKREDDPLNPRTPKAAILRMEVAAWVRKIGVDDPGVSPNHSWRHLFKQIAERHGISERVSDAITGHAPTTAGRGYGAPNLEDMARELGKFPRYKT
jgi:integrase